MTLDCAHPSKDIEKRLESIYALHIKKMDFRLDKGPYIDLLAALGNPHFNLPPVIHVAGTNGKGSTIAFLKSLCEAAGLSVHTYTSPHLIKFNERITLAGHYISDNDLIHYLDMTDKANNGNSVTFFEYTTALAFRAFADNPADICILETGLGGRLDCTNVIPNPKATIITSIGYDHMDWLGHDIASIATEKAGIIKKDAPCFIAPQTYDDQIRDVFVNKTAEVGCPLHFVERAADLPTLGLIGDHQKDNASVALTVFKTIGLQSISNIAATQALAKAQWPARMEKLSDYPEIWFDCGHNKDGAIVIAAQLSQWKRDNSTRAIHLILGLAADKNPHDFLNLLMPFIDSITCVDLPNARNPQMGTELFERIKNNQNETVTVRNGHTIKNAIHSLEKNNALTIISGSLYLYDPSKAAIPIE